jgi:hypothetical protein
MLALACMSRGAGSGVGRTRTKWPENTWREVLFGACCAVSGSGESCATQERSTHLFPSAEIEAKRPDAAAMLLAKRKHTDNDSAVLCIRHKTAGYV